ncbi:MAG: hypothetical protein ABFE07_24090 [Armatimonadia bacterium]
MITLALPFPVSTNRIWRIGRSRKTGKLKNYRQERYVSWERAADGFFVEQRGSRLPKISGKFCAHVVLSERRRANRDADNFVKCVLDFCQRVELIADDNLCNRLLVEWGHVEAPAGCIVTLSPVE